MSEDYEKCNIQGCSRNAKYRLINDGLVVCERCKQACIYEGQDEEEDFENMVPEVSE